MRVTRVTRVTGERTAILIIGFRLMMGCGAMALSFLLTGSIFMTTDSSLKPMGIAFLSCGGLALLVSIVGCCITCRAYQNRSDLEPHHTTVITSTSPGTYPSQPAAFPHPSAAYPPQPGAYPHPPGPYSSPPPPYPHKENAGSPVQPEGYQQHGAINQGFISHSEIPPSYQESVSPPPTSPASQ